MSNPIKVAEKGATELKISNGTLNRLEKIRKTVSLPMPSCYGNKFEWASAWIEENGVTLPPDTSETRSLRNWFCFKIDQYKKGILGPDNELQLALHGIDFSQYEALSTGKGERESDILLSSKLLAWKSTNGTYDLTKDSPDDLINWQSKLLVRFYAEGESLRMQNILQLVPGICFETWRKPLQSRLAPDYLAWWSAARDYESGVVSCEAYRGGLHPNAPSKLYKWAAAQQQEFESGKIEGWKLGFLRKNGIIDNSKRYKVSGSREKALHLMRGGDEAQAGFGKKDRRLDSILGALLAIRLVHFGSTDRELCVELKLVPKHAVAVRRHIAADKTVEVLGKQSLTVCRMICLNYANAFSPAFLDQIHSDPSLRPNAMTHRVLAFGKLAFSISRAGYETLQLADVY